jgi:hypothetical protein
MENEMEFKTWTRKANALAAVKKETDRLGWETPDVIEAVANDVTGAGTKWSVTITVAGTEEQARAVQEQLGALCEVQATGQAPARPEDTPEDAEEAVQKPKGERKSAAGARRLFVVNGHEPYRAGTGAAQTYEMVKENPGITYSEVKKNGGRMNILAECLRNGWVEARE